MKYTNFFILIMMCALAACTPKTSEEAQQESNEQTSSKPVVTDNPCATFSDSRRGEAAMDAHVIYRDYIRADRFEQALPYWRKAFAAAPAADGNRQTHYEDGIDIYEYFMGQETTDEAKLVYLDSIFMLYDKMEPCYHPGDSGYIAGRKAFDLYYKYRDIVDNETIYSYFTRSLDIDGVDAQAFVVNPFTALLVEMYQNKEISREEASRYARLVLDITEAHADDEEEGWPIVVGYAPVRLETFETVKGFFDCSFFREKYFDSLDIATADCEEIFLVGTRLRFGGCDMGSPELKTLSAEYQKRCAVAREDTLLTRARDALENERYSEAVDLYGRYLSSLDDPERSAKYCLRVAKIYYAHLRNFPQARKWAYKALESRPNWGEPYMLIGKLYASSGPLCGPGRGWDSQIVTWPAIDKFQKAKSVDPSVASEANSLIRRYRQFMPSVEDIFQRQLEEGSSFRVGCWIQENTRIRAAR